MQQTVEDANQMINHDTLSHSAPTTYDQDDDSAEEHPGLATLCLRVLTTLFGLFILLPLVLFSPVALIILAIMNQDKEQPVTEIPGGQPGSFGRHPGVIPASAEELGVELIAG